jgi:hypothetical protein
VLLADFIHRTAPQVTVCIFLYISPRSFRILITKSQGLYIVTDLYPFHLQARKVRISFPCNWCSPDRYHSSTYGRWVSLFRHSSRRLPVVSLSPAKIGDGHTDSGACIQLSWSSSSSSSWRRRKSSHYSQLATTLSSPTTECTTGRLSPFQNGPRPVSVTELRRCSVSPDTKWHIIEPHGSLRSSRNLMCAGDLMSWPS